MRRIIAVEKIARRTIILKEVQNMEFLDGLAWTDIDFGFVRCLSVTIAIGQIIVIVNSSIDRFYSKFSMTFTKFGSFE
jgi:hypothetical protein